MNCTSARSILLLGAAVLAALAPGFASARSLSRAEYEACQARDEAGFRTAVEALTRASLEAALGRMNTQAVIADEWRRAGIDNLIDRQVDAAIADVRNETSWTERARSLVSSDKTRELATAVAEKTFQSPQMKTAFEALAGSASRELGRSLEVGAQDSADPARDCLRAFLGPRYGSTVAQAVSDASDAASPSAAVAGGSVHPGLTPGAAGVGGVATLALRQVLNRMATGIGQRVVGAVLTRLVSLVGLWVGLALIAKDIYDARHYFVDGMLPAIASEMKTPETKIKIREEIVKAVIEQTSEHVTEISTATADRVVVIWQEFRRAHAAVLQLTERHPEMRRFIDQLKAEELPRLDEIVAIVVEGEGEAGVLRRLGDGSLARAVRQLSPAALQIARDLRSLAPAIAWADLAGADLAGVVTFDLHRRSKPADFTSAGLKRVLAFDERIVVQRLTGLPRAARETLLELPDGEVRSVARGQTQSELEALSVYLTSLDKPSSRRLLSAVLKDPARMTSLSGARVRVAVLGSKDQGAALDMVLRPPGFDIQALQRDVRLAADGKVNPVLLWDAHPYAVIGAGFGILGLLLMLRRLFGRRATPRPA